jgi:hypothetical protein
MPHVVRGEHGGLDAVIGHIEANSPPLALSSPTSACSAASSGNRAAVKRRLPTNALALLGQFTEAVPYHDGAAAGQG